MKVKWSGIDKMNEDIRKKANIDFDELAKDSAKSLFSRSQKGKGTPVGDYVGGGQLRASANYNKFEFGYRKDYAPHVEYGHRTRGGGIVPGQYYLRSNVAKEKKLYIKRLKAALRGD